MPETYKWILQSISAMVMIGITMASVLGMIMVVVPQAMQTWELKQEIDELKINRDQLAAKVASLSDLDKEQISDRLTVISQALPEEQNIPYVISTLKQLADEYQVLISGVGVAVQEETTTVTRASEQVLSGVNTQLLDLRVKAGPDAIVSYIEEIERVNPLIKVNKVAATLDQERSLQTNLMIETYVMPRPANEAKTGDDKLPFEAVDERLLDSIRQRKAFEFIPATLPGTECLDPFTLGC